MSPAKKKTTTKKKNGGSQPESKSKQDGGGQSLNHKKRFGVSSSSPEEIGLKLNTTREEQYMRILWLLSEPFFDEYKYEMSLMGYLQWFDDISRYGFLTSSQEAAALSRTLDALDEALENPYPDQDYLDNVCYEVYSRWPIEDTSIYTLLRKLDLGEYHATLVNVVLRSKWMIAERPNANTATRRMGKGHMTCLSKIPGVFPEDDDYYRKYMAVAQGHWDMMTLYKKQADTAKANGNKEEEKKCLDAANKLRETAEQATVRAGQDIFDDRNKDYIFETFPVDLRGQHEKEGMEIFSLFLELGVYVRYFRQLRVITGHGSDGTGGPQLKDSVIKLLRDEKIEWGYEIIRRKTNGIRRKEKDPGVLLIKFNGMKRELDFVKCRISGKGRMTSLNKDYIFETFPVDLHGQREKEGMEIFSLFLKLGVCVRYFRQLRVITGKGEHGTGPPVLKSSVIKLLDDEQIKWEYETVSGNTNGIEQPKENPGVLLVKFDGKNREKRELDFVKYRTKALNAV